VPIRKGRSWNKHLEEKFGPDYIQEIRDAAADELEELKTLRALRKKLGISQVELAEILEISQPRLSTVENSEDQLLSTLRRYIEGLGGTLELVAVFWDSEDEREIRIPLTEVTPNETGETDAGVLKVRIERSRDAATDAG